MTRERAETLGATALGWIAGDGEMLSRFLSATGADPATLRAQAAEPDFLGFVLDFILSDEAALLAFAEASGERPEAAAAARAALPGGNLPHWT